MTTATATAKRVTAKPAGAAPAPKSARTKAAKSVTPKVAVEKKSRVAVSEPNLRKAAARLLTSALVSTELAYIQRTLGSSTTQEELDQKVVAVRSMPWASIVEAE